MSSHVKCVMMEAIDGCELKLMNSVKAVHQNSLAYPLVLLLYPLVLSEHAVMKCGCAQHIGKKQQSDCMCTCMDDTEEN